MDFGCFVDLQGFRTKQEGLVHLSNISATKRGGSAKELVNKGVPRVPALRRAVCRVPCGVMLAFCESPPRPSPALHSSLRAAAAVNAAGEPVWVKVVSKTGQRLGLAMRDVDQVTGTDLLPMQNGGAAAAAFGAGGFGGASNPAGPGAGGAATGANQTALHGLSGIKVKEDDPLDAGGRPKRRGKVMSDYEKWEIAQLIKSGEPCSAECC